MELIILGAGGCAREVRIWAEDCGMKVDYFFNSLGHGIEYVDGLEVLTSLPRNDAFYVVAVGDPKLREKLHLLAQAQGLRLCDPIVHPKSFVGRNVCIGKGSIICPGVVLTTNINVGRNTIIHYNATVGHDVVIGDSCMVAPGANISGNCYIERRTYIGANAVIREKTSVGEDSVLGAGSVLVKHLPAREVWAGNPARKLEIK